MPHAILIVDDERTFDPARLGLGPDDVLVHARTSAEGLRRLSGRHWDEVWLDFDLGGKDTAMPVVRELLRAGHEGAPFDLYRVVVHSANVAVAGRMVEDMGRFYRAERLYDPRPYLARDKKGRTSGLR